MNPEQRIKIDKLYYQLYDFLLTYADSSLGNSALAEEAVQETFAIACKKPEQVCTSPNPEGWIVNTMMFVICNIESRRRTALNIIADLPGFCVELHAAPEVPLDLHILYGDLADTKEFRLIYAMAIEGKSMVELAAELGVSVEACKKRAERARKYLQKKIDHMSLLRGRRTYIDGKEEQKKCPR